MNKLDLTIILALATAAQKAGLIKLEEMERVGSAYRRAAEMHKLMGERDTLAINQAAEIQAPSEAGKMTATMSEPKGRAAKK